MRPPKACYGCRQSKRKCTRRSGRVGDACDQCQARNLKCAGSLTNAPARRLPLLPRSESPLEATLNNSVDVTNVTIDVAVRLVDSYLTKLHNRPHSLFHPVTLREKVRDGSINKPLLLAICSMGARFDDDEIRSLENNYMDESKRLLLADLERICIENAQTCILLANLYAAHLNPSSEALFFRKCSTRKWLL